MSFFVRIIGVIFRIMICAGYDEEWWEGVIPIYGDYVLCTLVASPIYFFINWGALIASVISIGVGSTFLAGMFYIIAMIAYSIIMFALFVNTSKQSVKIPVVCMFVAEVIFGSINFFSEIIPGVA